MQEVSVNQIRPHVIEVRSDPYPTVALARQAWEAIEAGLPEGSVALYVSGPVPVAPAEPVAIGKNEADDEAEPER